MINYTLRYKFRPDLTNDEIQKLLCDVDDILIKTNAQEYNSQYTEIQKLRVTMKGCTEAREGISQFCADEKCLHLTFMFLSRFMETDNRILRYIVFLDN